MVVAAQAVALNDGQHGLARATDQSVVGVAVVECFTQSPLLPLHVPAGSEILARSGDDDHADPGVVVGLIEGSEHLVDGGQGHGVVFVRLVDRHPGDAAAQSLVVLFVVKDLFEGHAPALDLFPVGPTHW